MNKFKTYQMSSYRKGYDDLKGTHAWVASAQGDHSWSNNVNADHSWLIKSREFEDCYTQEEINQRIRENEEWNANYIQELIAAGEYGEEMEGGTLTVVYNEMWDKPNGSCIESSEFIFLDHKDNEAKEYAEWWRKTTQKKIQEKILKAWKEFQYSFWKDEYKKEG